MSINGKGIVYIKPTSYSIEPDPHSCSFNRMKVVKIEQEGGIVFLAEHELKIAIEFLENSK